MPKDDIGGSRTDRSSQKLLVANTHLLYNPKRGDVKLGQLALLLASLDSAARKPSQSASTSTGPGAQAAVGVKGEKYPVILCGDFNSEPLSPLYKFLVGRTLKYEGQKQCELSGQGKIGGRTLDKRLIPPQAGVTDSCQFVHQWQQSAPVAEEYSDDCLIIEGKNTSEGKIYFPINRSRGIWFWQKKGI